MVLAADEGEAHAQFQHEVAEMFHQSPLQFALPCLVGQRKEIEDVGVLEYLLSQVGLSRRQRLREVGDRPALAAVEVQLDLMHQHGPRPAMLDGFFGVPEALLRVLEFLDQYDVVAPGNFCHSLRQIYPVWSRQDCGRWSSGNCRASCATIAAVNCPAGCGTIASSFV